MEHSVVDCTALSKTAMEEIYGGDGEHDFHAGKVETSLIKCWKPEIVRDEMVEGFIDYVNTIEKARKN